MTVADVLRILRDAGRAYARHASVVVGASLMLQVVATFVSFLLLAQVGPEGFWVVGVVNMIVGQLMIGVYTLLLTHVRTDTGVPTISTLLTATLPRLPALLVLSIGTGIAISFGSLLLVVPGVYLALRWAVAAPAMIAGRLPVGEALKASGSLTKGVFGPVFVILMVEAAFTTALPEIAARMADLNVENYVISLGVVNALFAPLPALALAELFFRLAGHPSGGAASVEQPAPAHRVHVPIPTTAAMAPMAGAGPGTPVVCGATLPNAVQPQVAQAQAIGPVYGAPHGPPAGAASSHVAPPEAAPPAPPHAAYPLAGHASPAPPTQPTRTHSVPPPGMG